MGDDFNTFCQTAKALTGTPDLDHEWLKGVWQGADGDMNRAMNHVYDAPEKKTSSGGGSITF